MHPKEIDGNLLVENVTDLDLLQTLDCGQCFRWIQNDDNTFVGVVKNRVLRIKKQDDTLIFYNTSLQDFFNIWQDYFDLSTDYSKIKEIVSSDAVLEMACKFAPGIRVLKQEPWEALCSFIISQNNNIKRIKGIVERLCECYGEQLEDGFYTFPSPDALKDLTIEDLSPLRAGFRARYILDAAKKVSDGTVNLDRIKTLPIDDARNELMQIVGVGVKVADCALLYGFGRIEVFPTDVWIKKALTHLLPNGLPDTAKPYAGIVQQYIFHYVRVCPDALPRDI